MEMLDTLRSWLNQLWDMPLYTSGDNQVLFNQLVIAVLVVILGLIFSRWVSNVFGKRLSTQGRLDRNAAHLLRKILHYLLTVIVVLVALPIAGIPITIFTVLGGALAIGVGFGAQNLFNNLISGFMIMVERPIRIGDIVEIEGREGRIDDIANRCVRIRRTDGVDVLMPNSFFLEQPVVNWTLSDSEVRGKVIVGVAYGSPTKKVRNLMEAAAKKHPRILQDHEIEVLFEDFGDSALIFTLLFWTHVSRPMDLRRIQSDLRYEIDDRFREEGITIAFPQMDVHLDTLSPLKLDRSADPSSD